MTKETNWRGNAFSYSYDKWDRLIEIKDPTDTVVETIVYDNSDAKISSTDALGNTTYFYYDFKGRLIGEKDALLHESKRSYDGMGNVITEIDAGNNITSYSYNAFGKLIEVNDALGQITSYDYDNNGNMLSQTDANGNKTTYYYTSHNQLTLKAAPDGINSSGQVVASLAESYAYFANGLPAGKIDHRGIRTQYVYNIHGWLLYERSVGAVTSTNSFTYDAKGNKLTAEEAGKLITWQYDSLGRVISKKVDNLAASTFKYDVTSGVSAGYTSEVTTDPKGNVTTKIYDKAGRLYSVSSPSGNITYTYFANGNKKKISYPGSVTAEYTYYADNRLHTLSNKKGSTVLEAYSYSHDARGNITSKTDIKGTTNYTYDALNRVLTVTQPGANVTSYDYDGAGNRITETIEVNGTTTLNKTYQYNNMNWLTNMITTPSTGSAINAAFKYDSNGNTIRKTEGTDITNYTYDTRNRMIATIGNGYQIASIYNPEGYRIKKTVTGAGSTQYIYEYDKVILEMNASGTETGRNVYGDDTLLYRTASGTTLYYLYNGHGDVTALVNSSGTIVASYYYDAFGVVTDETGGTTAANNSYRYSGYQYDKEGGLYYLNSRYYSPEIARFINQDTYTGDVRDPLSLNLYTYVSNNPLRYIDPTGHLQYDDDKYNYQTQLALIGWTSGFNFADNDAERQAAQDAANALRIPENEKGAPSSTAINWLSDREMQQVDAVMMAFKGLIDSGHEYVTKEEWLEIMNAANIKVDQSRYETPGKSYSDVAVGSRYTEVKNTNVVSTIFRNFYVNVTIQSTSVAGLLAVVKKNGKLKIELYSKDGAADMVIVRRNSPRPKPQEPEELEIREEAFDIAQSLIGKTEIEIKGIMYEVNPDNGLVKLPVSGVGYENYFYEFGRKWGSLGAIYTVVSVAEIWAETGSGIDLMFGELSTRSGGNGGKHVSHNGGIDVDLRPVRTDDQRVGVKYNYPEYDRAATQKLIEIILSNDNVEDVLFNDPVLIAAFDGKVRALDGHDDHLHINMIR